MRLLHREDDGSYRLASFRDNEIPRYAILSHTWGPDADEVNFDDIETERGTQKAGYKKIKFCGEQTAKDGLEYFWVDTCCIDKTNSAELEKSLIRMFDWYKQSEKCYVYLSDVHSQSLGQDERLARATWKLDFRACRWLTRGWTLQELIAPQSVEFFSSTWEKLGDKISLGQTISEITNIPGSAFQNKNLFEYSVDERMSWTKGRETTQKEDLAYCLQGIFDVSLPPRYGEGRDKAFSRLETAIYENPDLVKTADHYIRTRYYTNNILRITRLSGAPLPMEQCYINLAIVKQSRGKNEKLHTITESSHFSLGQRLRVVTPEKNIQVELPTLFNTRQETGGQTTAKAPKRILIRGRAGIGKTTLCKKIVFDFKQNCLWNNLFDRVLWIPLRNLKSLQSSSNAFETIFLHEYFHNEKYGEHLSRSLANMVRKSVELGKKNRTLFILDGFDEVSQEWEHHDGRFKLLVKLLDQPNVIITSRPHANIPYNVCQPLDLELETVGFYPNQVHEYLTKSIDDPNKVKNIQDFLESHQLLKDLVRIPIQLDALCYIWDSIQDFNNGTVPQTMTAIYHAMEHSFWKKDIVRLGRKSRQKPITEESIRHFSSTKVEEVIEDELLLLEFLAFTGLHNNVISFNERTREATLKCFKSFHHGELPDQELQELSFLRTSGSQKGPYMNYHFLHLTFQEYFAARYFVRQWISKATLCVLLLNERRTEKIPSSYYLQKYKYDTTYDIFWRFVVGLIEERDEEQVELFFRTIEKSPDLLGPTHYRLLMHCLSELTTSNWMRKQLETRLQAWILFEINICEASSLVRAVECPVDILQNLLGGDRKVAIFVLKDLRSRHVSLSSRVVPSIGRFLDDRNSRVRSAAVLALAGGAGTSGHIQQLLLNRLDDPDSHVRNDAIDALGGAAGTSDQILLLLLKRLDDPGSGVLRAAVAALAGVAGDSDQIQQQLLKRLGSSDSLVRIKTANALRGAASTSDHIQQQLLKRLGDSDSNVRSAAVLALARAAGTSDQIQLLLLKRLDDPDSNVRSAVVLALAGRAGTSHHIQQLLLKRLDDPDKYVRSYAIRAFYGAAGTSDPIQQELLKRLDDSESSVRRAAVEVLAGAAGTSDPIQQELLKRLDDPDRIVRYAAVKSLAVAVGTSDQIQQLLLKRLDDPDKFVRSYAGDVLAGVAATSDQIKQQLLKRLDKSDGYVRLAAVRALAGAASTSDQIQKLLLKRLDDSNSLVRRAAVDALAGAAGASDYIQQELLKRLDDPDSHVRRAAVEYLAAAVGTSDQIQLLLLKRLDDSDSDVRRATVEAIFSAYGILKSVLNSKFANILYKAVLKQSFSEQHVWYLEGHTLNIVYSGKVHRIDGAQEIVERICRGRPDGYPVE